MLKKQFNVQLLLPWSLIFLGVLLRLWQFGNSVPSSLNRDEAALGYNAYALATGGIDEWGRRWPLLFQSFGDYKLPGYVYTLVPLVRVFGLEPWVVRLPSLLSGLGLIWLTYVIYASFIPKTEGRWWAAALLALSPWAIFYSRMAFEANLGLFLFGLALWFLLQPLSVATFFGLVFYALATLTYNTPLLLAPILLVCVVFMSKKRRDGVIKSLSVAVVAGLVVLLLQPLVSQKKNITVFSDPTILSQQRDFYSGSTHFFEKLWNHQITYLGREMLVRLAASVSPNFLTMHGGANPWHSVPGTGHVLWSVYIFAAIGLAWAVITQRQWRVFLFLLAGSLLPAITTVDAPHATRSLLFLWLLVFPAGLLISRLRSVSSWFLVGVSIVVVLEIGMYARTYFERMSGELGSAWPNGLASVLTAAPDKPSPVVIRNSDGGDISEEQPYVFVLFFQKTPPQQFLNTVQYGPVDNAGLIRVLSFDRFWFANADQSTPESAYIIERDVKGHYERKK